MRFDINYKIQIIIINSRNLGIDSRTRNESNLIDIQFSMKSNRTEPIIKTNRIEPNQTAHTTIQITFVIGIVGVFIDISD